MAKDKQSRNRNSKEAPSDPRGGTRRRGDLRNNTVPRALGVMLLLFKNIHLKPSHLVIISQKRTPKHVKSLRNKSNDEQQSQSSKKFLIYSCRHRKKFKRPREKPNLIQWFCGQYLARRVSHSATSSRPSRVGSLCQGTNGKDHENGILGGFMHSPTNG